MVDIKRKYEIKKLHFPVDIFNYDAQVWISTDGGENYYHCGIGKFCKTEEDANNYINEYEASHK